MFELLILLTITSIVNSCSLRCVDNEVIGLSNDIHSYVQCVNGNAYLRHCSNGMVFDGQICGQPFKCPHLNGKYANQHNDSQYYRCWSGQANLESCPFGTLFNGRECANDPRISKRSPYSCPELNGVFVNPDSKYSYMECVNGRARIQTCALLTYGNTISYGVFDGKQCVNWNTEAFDCPERTGLYRYPRNHSQYYECSLGTLHLRDCPRHTVFDGQNCVAFGHHHRANHFRCPAPTGYFADPNDPNGYYVCDEGRHTRGACRPGFIFSGQTCIDRHHRHEYRCPDPNGKFINPRNSSEYYVCHYGRVSLHTCAFDHIFNGEECVIDPRRHHRHRFVCPQSYGTFANTHDEHQYYLCRNGEPYLESCQAGFYYDGRTCVERRHRHSSGKLIMKNRHRVEFNFDGKHYVDELDERSQKWIRTVVGPAVAGLGGPVPVVEPVVVAPAHDMTESDESEESEEQLEDRGMPGLSGPP